MQDLHAEPPTTCSTFAYLQQAARACASWPGVLVSADAHAQQILFQKQADVACALRGNLLTCMADPFMVVLPDLGCDSWEGAQHADVLLIRKL